MSMRTMQGVQNKVREQKDNDEYSKNFARIPNMLFVSYKFLTKEEKFLYCALKSVYWDAKPRYVSLRELGEMTNYSASALSKMIPRLHACALVHAEIRREKDKQGREYGNAKYNITILDIWELNRAYFSCSPNERDLLDPSQKLVHETNEPVHQMNELVHETLRARSPNEHVRAQPKLTKESIKTSLKKKKDVVVANISEIEQNNNDDSFSDISFSSEQTPAKKQQSNKPAVGGNDRKTSNACFKDEFEQAIFDIARQAQCMANSSEMPSTSARGHVAKIAALLMKQGIPASRLSPQNFEEAWQEEKRIKKLDSEAECQWGNLSNATPRMLVKMAKETPRIAATPGTYTFLKKTADYLLEMAEIQGSDKEEALAIVQKYYEKSTMTKDQFDEFIGTSIMSNRNWLHDLATA